jgi:hypothetical protein
MEEAYKVIDSLHYKGERTTFMFEHFTGLLTRSYNDLQCFGEPVLESKEVWDLLAKISNPKLDSAKQAIWINVDYKNDFSMAINFLAERVETVDLNKTHNISGIQQGNYEHFNRGGRGNRGRVHHSGRHNNQNGRGNHVGNGRGGGQRGRGHTNGANNGGRSVSTKTYIPPSEWNAMMPEQKQTFLQTRAASCIQAITTSLNNDISTITNATKVLHKLRVKAISWLHYKLPVLTQMLVLPLHQMSQSLMEAELRMLTETGDIGKPPR